MLRRYVGIISPRILDVQTPARQFATTLDSAMQQGNKPTKADKDKGQAKGKKDGEKAYASTLLLPKTSFPIWIEPSITRDKYHERTTQQLYEWQVTHLKEPTFILHDGPPYANGNLHSGHALNKILKDVILRYQILQGRKVNYVPGWDCHGLPVENKALEKLKAEPNSLSAVAVRAAAKQTAEEAIHVQREEMQQFGLVGNWTKEGTYRTMDPSFESRQLRIFQSMVKQGIIYRQFRPVHWSPSSQTALAEAELQYEMHTSTAAYVAFMAEGSSIPPALKVLIGQDALKLLIWTTTPWTLPTNMAIAVHPEMEYSVIRRTEHESESIIVATSRLASLEKILGSYTVIGSIQGSKLKGTVYKPLFSGPSSTVVRPVIIGDNVLDDAGTGLVHMAPSHGHEDYQSFLELGLLQNNPLINIVDSQGRYTVGVEDVCSEDVAKKLVGLEVLFKGNKEVLSLLEERGSGSYLLGVERYRHRYPYDWRTGKPLIIRATAQWFANLDGIKQRAEKALESVEFYPPISRNRLDAFIRERSEWCISRQRSWGVPIPSLHVLDTDEAILDEESLGHILAVLEERGTSYWWEGPIEAFMSPAVAAKYSPESLVKGTDTMDVWFDSGTSWSMLENGVADVYLEGSDQHRGWFQSSLLTAIATTEPHSPPKSPFRKAITHGFVLDEKGRKMSKSLGNVISPLTVINGGSNLKADPAYGTDVLRLWALSSQYSGDVTLSKVALKQAAELHRKLRMTARFILGSLQDKLDVGAVPRTELSLLDCYVLHEVWTLARDAQRSYEAFAFHEIVASLSHFINVTLSSLYFDVNKDVLYADPVSSKARIAALYVLQSTLQTILPIIAPLVPYLAEEVNASNLLPSIHDSSVFSQGWKAVNENWNDQSAHQNMGTLLQVRKKVTELLEQARTDKKIRSSLEADVLIILPDNARANTLGQLLYSQHTLLSQLFIVSEVSLENNKDVTSGHDWTFSDIFPLPGTEGHIRVVILPARRQKCPRCWSFVKEPEDVICGRCQTTLASS